MKYLRHPRRFDVPEFSRETPPKIDPIQDLGTEDQEPIDPFAAFVAEDSLSDGELRPKRPDEDHDSLSSYDTEGVEDRIVTGGDVPLSEADNTPSISSDPSLLRASHAVRNTLVAGAALVMALLLSVAVFRAIPSRSPGKVVSSPAAIGAATTLTGSRPASVPDTSRESRGSIGSQPSPPAIAGTAELPAHSKSVEALPVARTSRPSVRDALS